MQKNTIIQIAQMAILLIGIQFISCTYEKLKEVPDPPIEMEELGPCPPKSIHQIADCHYTSTWYPAKIHDELIGTWKWRYNICFWFPQNATCDSLFIHTMEFKNNDSLYLMTNDKLVYSAKWKVIQEDHNSFSLEVNPSVTALHGYIYFCEDLLAFNYSWIDGCDNIFRKKN